VTLLVWHSSCHTSQPVLFRATDDDPELLSVCRCCVGVRCLLTTDMWAHWPGSRNPPSDRYHTQTELICLTRVAVDENAVRRRYVVWLVAMWSCVVAIVCTVCGAQLISICCARGWSQRAVTCHLSVLPTTCLLVRLSLCLSLCLALSVCLSVPLLLLLLYWPMPSDWLCLFRELQLTAFISLHCPITITAYTSQYITNTAWTSSEIKETGVSLDGPGVAYRPQCR